MHGSLQFFAFGLLSLLSFFECCGPLGIRVEKEEFGAFACSRHVGFREYVASCGRTEVSPL